MKTTLLVLMLARTDTIPYIHEPYYSEDTLYTMRDLRTVNRRQTATIKQAERQGTTGFLVGVLLGVIGGLGVALTIR